MIVAGLKVTPNQKGCCFVASWNVGQSELRTNSFGSKWKKKLNRRFYTQHFDGFTRNNYLTILRRITSKRGQKPSLFLSFTVCTKKSTVPRNSKKKNLTEFRTYMANFIDDGTLSGISFLLYVADMFPSTFTHLELFSTGLYVNLAIRLFLQERAHAKTWEYANQPWLWKRTRLPPERIG